MGFRLRKSFNFGPFRLNLSKSGIGYSVGTKGFRVTKKATGGTRATASIPGTGISYVKESATKNTTGGNTMAKKKSTKLSGKAIGGLAALCVVGAIVGGGGEEEAPAAAASSQNFGDVSVSVSAPASSVSDALPGGAEIPDASTPEEPAAPVVDVPEPEPEPAAPPESSVEVNQTETPAAVEAPAAPVEPEPVVVTYIGNSNTMKFHERGCPSVEDIKPGNKVTISGRSNAISQGYDPCGRCHP